MASVGAPAREYPDRPVIGVSGVVLLPEGGIVLVQRRHPPLAGEWSLPGGVIDLGEPLAEGLAREVREETGLVVVSGPIVDVIEHVERDGTGRVRYHYVVVNFVCRGDGSPRAAEDAMAVAVASPSELATYRLATRTLEVIARARRVHAEMP